VSQSSCRCTGAGGDQTQSCLQAWLRGPQHHVRAAHSMLRDDCPCSDFVTTYETKFCFCKNNKRTIIITGLFHPDPTLLPLRFRSTRVHAAQARVCWRAQSTVDSLFFIDVPTNPRLSRPAGCTPQRMGRRAGRPAITSHFVSLSTARYGTPNFFEKVKRDGTWSSCNKYTVKCAVTS